MGTTRRSFTLIELLTVIGIIAILIGVLVPSMSRSLSGNRLASDVEVLRAKIEETRLLAGSTQTKDELTGSEQEGSDRVGYYGIYIPPSDIINGSPPQFYAIVRLSNPVTKTGDGYCNGYKATIDAINNNVNSGTCLIERVNLTDGVKYNEVSTYNLQHKLIAFRVPTQQLNEIFCKRPCGNPYDYELNPAPIFPQRDVDNNVVGDKYFQLSYKNKTATIRIESYTGKLNVIYN